MPRAEFLGRVAIPLLLPHSAISLASHPLLLSPLLSPLLQNGPLISWTLECGPLLHSFSLYHARSSETAKAKPATGKKSLIKSERGDFLEGSIRVLRPTDGVDVQETDLDGDLRGDGEEERTFMATSAPNGNTAAAWARCCTKGWLARSMNIFLEG